jgi:SAM-dependent methyltransferase
MSAVCRPPSAVAQLVRFAFRLLYNQLAWTYDWVSRTVSLGQWRSWQRAALVRLRGPRVLEVAHGTGDLLLDLEDAGFAPVGLDPSPAMGRLARRKLRQRGRAVPLIRGRAQALPFASESFPSMVTTFPTEFILDPRSLDEFRRVLMPGGRLVIVGEGRLTGSNILVRALEWLYAITGQRGPWPPDPQALFSVAGFDLAMEVDTLPRSEVVLVVATRISRAGTSEVAEI